VPACASKRGQLPSFRHQCPRHQAVHNQANLDFFFIAGFDLDFVRGDRNGLAGQVRQQVDKLLDGAPATDTVTRP
jgi:hypothetical protein